MVFELVHGLFSRDSVLRSWTPEPIMGNGASVDQGGHTTHGTRDGSEVVKSERYDWSELARAPITKQPISLLSTDRNFYIGAQRGARVFNATSPNKRPSEFPYTTELGRLLRTCTTKASHTRPAY